MRRSLRAFGAKSAALPFAHGARHALKPAGAMLFDSYHCSRYNTNTGVLTDTMFQDVFAAIRAELDRSLRGRDAVRRRRGQGRTT